MANGQQGPGVPGPPGGAGEQPDAERSAAQKLVTRIHADLTTFANMLGSIPNGEQAAQQVQALAESYRNIVLNLDKVLQSGGQSQPQGQAQPPAPQGPPEQSRAVPAEGGPSPISGGPGAVPREA